MEAILEQARRKLKGKAPEYRNDQSTYDSSEGSRKRKSGENVEKPHKRQKTLEEKFEYESCTSDKAAGDKEVTSATVGNDAPSQGCQAGKEVIAMNLLEKAKEQGQSGTSGTD